MALIGRPTPASYIAGIFLAAAGEILRIWAAGHLVKSDELTVSGPFGWVRNPLYIGSLLITCGYCAMTGGWLVWAVVVPLFMVFHAAAILWEERFLVQQFGEAFKTYCKRVPRVIPRPPARPSTGPGFSWLQVRINREDKTVLGTVLIVILFGLKMVFLN